MFVRRKKEILQTFTGVGFYFVYFRAGFHVRVGAEAPKFNLVYS
jgi:hypothetical protein